MKNLLCLHHLLHFYHDFHNGIDALPIHPVDLSSYLKQLHSIRSRGYQTKSQHYLATTIFFD